MTAVVKYVVTQAMSNKQKVSGVILVDKPQGMTSQQVVSKVKYLFQSPAHNSKKAGHTGTLDPMATGLLPICLGEATKFSHYQLDADKSYQATILLGSQTNTGDAEGKIIDEAVLPNIDSAILKQAEKEFLGAQQQIPPMYSALKKDGKKLYEYAREGIEIERPARDITIKAIELDVIDDAQLKLTVTCSKGTYIRVLAEDIAQYLGTLGHLTALRRTQVGKFNIDAAIDLTALENLAFTERFNRLLAIDACIDIAAELPLTTEQCKRVRLGQRLNVSEQISESLRRYISQTVTLAKQKGYQADSQELKVQTPEYELPVDIKLIDEQGQFVGLGALSLNGRLQPKKIIHP